MCPTINAVDWCEGRNEIVEIRKSRNWEFLEIATSADVRASSGRGRWHPARAATDAASEASPVSSRRPKYQFDVVASGR